MAIVHNTENFGTADIPSELLAKLGDRWASGAGPGRPEFVPPWGEGGTQTPDQTLPEGNVPPKAETPDTQPIEVDVPVVEPLAVKTTTRKKATTTKG